MDDGMIEMRVKMSKILLAIIIREAEKKYSIDKKNPIKKIEWVGDSLNFYFNSEPSNLEFSFGVEILEVENNG